MSVVKIKVRQVEAQAWEGYGIKTKLGRGDNKKAKKMPARVSWLEPDAADSFMAMQIASHFLMQFTDIYRRVQFQIDARIKAKGSKKYRLLAPPTKSGHNFGWSFDLAVKETLLAFRASGIPELIAAGQNRASLGEWMKQFGWTGIRSESWHFNFLGEHRSTVAKIDALYGDKLSLTDHELQMCLNDLLGRSIKPLTVDGIIGKRTIAACIKAYPKLDLNEVEARSTSKWFRRVLAGATAELVDVDA